MHSPECTKPRAFQTVRLVQNPVSAVAGTPTTCLENDRFGQLKLLYSSLLSRSSLSASSSWASQEHSNRSRAIGITHQHTHGRTSRLTGARMTSAFLPAP